MISMYNININTFCALLPKMITFTCLHIAALNLYLTSRISD